LRGLERIRADDRLARIVAIAVPPSGRRRRIVADDARPAPEPGPLLLERARAVTAEVARVAPQRAVRVEVLRREDVDGQRLDSGGDVAVPCASDPLLVALAVRSRASHPMRSDQPVLLRQAFELGGWKVFERLARRAERRGNRRIERRTAADADEVDPCGALRFGG